MAVTRKSNVIVMTANADSHTSAGQITSIILKPGSTSTTASLSLGGVTIWDAGTHAASGPAVQYSHLNINLGGKALVLTLSGTSAAVYIHTS